MVKRKIKVAIFHFGFFYSGGGEKLVLQEIEGLSKLGFDVTCFSPVIDSKYCFPDIINNYNIKTILPQLPKWFPHRYVIQILASCILIPLLFWRFLDYDIFIGANQPGPWFAFVLNKILKKPYVIYLAQPTRMLYPRKIDQETGLWITRKSYIFPFLVKIFKKFITWADSVSVRSASAALSNGEYMKMQLEKTYRREFTSCPAGADSSNLRRVNRFVGALKVNGFEIKKPYILLTNRHFPQKKFEYAISALPAVLTAVPEASLIITGQKTLYTRDLEELTHRLDLKNKVVFTGLVNEVDLKKLYSNAACYVYTAPEEDFGMGVVEAMSFGVPVVAWDSGGPAFLLDQGKTGFLVKKFDHGDLIKKINLILSDREMTEEMGKQSINFQRQRFSLDNHLKILVKALSREL